MSILLIDSGNTRLKLGLLEEDGAGPGYALDGGALCAASPRMTAHAIASNDIQALRDWIAALPVPPRTALGANVAGPARGSAIEDVLATYGCAVRWVVAQAQAYGLTSRYTRPEQLGADRWVSMVGVLAQVRAGHAEAGAGSSAGASLPPAAPAPAAPAFLLACFGTATTLDTVSGEGVFEGGLILPGPALMRQSLASGTANLPLAHGTLQDFPTDTHQAISSGVAAAQAGAVVRQWLAGARRFGEAPRVYAAGGAWDEVALETERLLADAAAGSGRLPPAITVIENPVLNGLAYLAASLEPDSP
jgi:type III pantothenate kinase